MVVGEIEPRFMTALNISTKQWMCAVARDGNFLGIVFLGKTILQ